GKARATASAGRTNTRNDDRARQSGKEGVRVRKADITGSQAETAEQLGGQTGQKAEKMKRLIECVPNFSEGRDAAKVDAIVTEMSSVQGVYVLDREMDADHNRSVVTLAGEPDAVAEAAVLCTGKARALGDLTKHAGAHQRVGATVVLP